MTSKDNKALIERYYRRFYGLGEKDALDATFSSGYVHHIPGAIDGRMDFKEYKEQETRYLDAFDGLTREILDVVDGGDKVVVRSVIRGTQTGDLPDIPASKKDIEVSSIVIYRVKDGKVVEGWEEYDSLGMMRQLEVVHMLSTLSKKPHRIDYYESMRTWPR